MMGSVHYSFRTFELWVKVIQRMKSNAKRVMLLPVPLHCETYGDIDVSSHDLFNYNQIGYTFTYLEKRS